MQDKHLLLALVPPDKRTHFFPLSFPFENALMRSSSNSTHCWWMSFIISKYLINSSCCQDNLTVPRRYYILFCSVRPVFGECFTYQKIINGIGELPRPKFAQSGFAGPLGPIMASPVFRVTEIYPGNVFQKFYHILLPLYHFINLCFFCAKKGVNFLQTLFRSFSPITAYSSSRKIFITHCLGGTLKNFLLLSAPL